MPACRVLAVMVMIAAVCPGGSTSSVEIGWEKRALRYSSLIVADILMLHVRKPILSRYQLIRTRARGLERAEPATHICYVIQGQPYEKQAYEI